MIEILLVCHLWLGQIYVPVVGWQIEKIEGGGVSTYSNCSNCGNSGSGDKATRITLKKQVKSGDILEPPDGCVLTGQQPRLSLSPKTEFRFGP